MFHHRVKSIHDYFSVSVVMSFYRKMRDFRRTFPLNARYFERNGIEVIIVLDEPGEEEDLLEFIGEYPCINWKIIINRQLHEWRNHCKVLNVGIRNASMEYVLIMDPECTFHTDLIYHFRYSLHYLENTFAVGNVLFGGYDMDETEIQKCITTGKLQPYGSVMARKEDFESVMGYEEDYEQWGAEDDNIRAKLELMGYWKSFIPEAIVIHREDDFQKAHRLRLGKSKDLPVSLLRRSFLPETVSCNPTNWGRDFSEIIFDWSNSKYKKDAERILSPFEQYERYSCGERDHFRVICLLQVHNEAAHLPQILVHMESHCDGIILLDDGSEDGSYEKAVLGKVLLKAKKRHTGTFNDLENRNLLLRMGSLFHCDWFIFMDADERFDPRCTSLLKLVETERFMRADVIRFRLVHVWNEPSLYREDMPEGKNGIVHRYRMFRKIGFLRITADRNIHFPAIPFKRNAHDAGLLILHYGLMDQDTREMKYRRYRIQDQNGAKQGYSYDYLMDKDVRLRPLSELPAQIR
jgi:glycosyltransferase involved in cell wall biosynthesis